MKNTSYTAPELPSLAGVEHRFIDLPGLRMHVAEAGTGEPVLLLHGFPQHWWEWRDVIPGLAEHYRVIAPDLRGAGWTDAPPDGYTKRRLTADVVALLDALGVDRVRLVAHDFSAIIGFGLCLDRPELVERYVALAVPHPFIRFDARLLPSMWRLWFQPVMATPGIGARVVGRGRQPVARYFFDYVVRPGGLPADDLELFLAPLRDPSRAEAGSLLYRHLILPEVWHILRGKYRDAQLDTPTLLMYGLADPGINPDVLGGFEHNASHMELGFIDDGSHYLVDDRPQEVLERTLEFFARPAAA